MAKAGFFDYVNHELKLVAIQMWKFNEIKLDCVFCKIVRGEYDSSKVYEDNDVIAFMDIMPVNEGHVLVTTKEHYENVDECPVDIFKKIAEVTKKLNPAVKKFSNSDGIFNAIMNGAAAGQEIFHLHMHIIPRHKNDGFGFRFPDGYGKKVERQKLDEAAERIRGGV